MEVEKKAVVDASTSKVALIDDVVNAAGYHYYEFTVLETFPGFIPSLYVGMTKIDVPEREAPPEPAEVPEGEEPPPPEPEKPLIDLPRRAVELQNSITKVLTSCSNKWVLGKTIIIKAD